MIDVDIKPKDNLEKIFNNMVEFVRNLGVKVNTNTKARGHQGFFLKDRIDICKDITLERKIEVLIHEFTHYIHAKIDSNIAKSGGDLEKLFPKSDVKRLSDELFAVTMYFDKNKGYKLLKAKRAGILGEIKAISTTIKNTYPEFKRSEPFKKIEKIIKKTDAKYLLKYDKVKIKTAFIGKLKYYSIDTLDSDFPQFDSNTKNYLLLKSKQRTLRRISSRITRITNYYKRPTELFARFVEALFIDTNKVSEIAPYTYLVFCKELSENRFLELADFINKFF